MRSPKKTRIPLALLLSGIMAATQGLLSAQDATPPDPISSIALVSASGGEIGVSWSATGDDGSSGALSPGRFRIDCSSDPNHAFSNSVYVLDMATTAAAGSAQYRALTGLVGNATYYVTVYIGDEVPNFSGLSQIGQRLTGAYQPGSGAFASVSSGSFTVSFSAGNSAGTQYYVDIATSTDYAVPVSSGWTASTSMNFSGLQPKTTYYARAKARDSSGSETDWAALGSVLLSQYPGSANPEAPLAEGVYSAGTFTLSWAAVARNVLGAAVNIKSYEIYQSTAIGAPMTSAASVSSATLSWSAAVSAAVRYAVGAVDEHNNTGAVSAWIKNTNGSAAVISDDGKAYLDAPKPVNDALKLQGLSPAVAREGALETGDTLYAYRVYFLDGAGTAVYGGEFPGEVSLTLPYSALSSFGGSPAVPRAAYDYAVFYDNGVEEVSIGGAVSASLGVLSVTAGRAGVFRVKAASRPQSFSVTRTVPKRIFTPNGDGVWDDFTVVYENPQALEISDAGIFDLSGARVASMSSGGGYGSDSLRWDGRRSGGEKAPADIYIYQFKAGDKYYNGTLVLAR